MSEEAKAAKLRIAWFSPLNCGERSGARLGGSRAAYFTDVVAPFLRSHFEITFFHDSFEKSDLGPTFHYLTALQRHADKPFDVFFYQLEDCPSSKFARMHVGLFPGVTLFHNFLFTDDGPEPILNSGWSDFVSHFAGRVSSFPERKKEYKKEGKAALREAGLSTVPVFLSEKDHGDYLNSVKLSILPPAERLSFYLPYPVAEKLSNTSIPGDPLKRVLLFCGSPQIEHRAHQLLKAIQQLKGRLELRWLVDEREKPQAEKLLSEFGVASGAQVITPRTPDRFERALGEAHFTAHTHFSVFGQIGPYLQQSIMAGRPALVTDFGYSDFLPDKILFKIPAGAGEAAVMQQTLRYLLTWGPEEFNTHAQKSREYGEETFGARNVAQQLSYILKRSLPLIKTTGVRWERFREKAQGALLAEVNAFQNTDVFPLGGNETLQKSFAELGWKQDG